MHPEILVITDRIKTRSQTSRADYVARMKAAGDAGSGRSQVSCGDFAHAIAASATADKLHLRNKDSKNIGIVTAYNDMLSAHQPFGTYPDIIKKAVREVGATAQVAGGVSAMCDGVTQGQPGMELSLFSRDVIAMATAISLSHNVFDAVMMLGVCDKIVPRLLIGALSFGHLPCIFVPAGPMTSGLPNKEKARVRQLYAEGKADRTALLEAEEKSYHGIGTCTLYETANSNQMLMEIMGLHLPSTAFINPGNEMRTLLTAGAGQKFAELAKTEQAPLYKIIDEKTIVNGLLGLMATGGSTNLALHIVAIVRAAGILIDWTDFADVSKVPPLLVRVYPNGFADVNVFHAAGGMAFLTRQLLEGGYLHPDTMTIAGRGLVNYTQEPYMKDGSLSWPAGTEKSLNEDVLRSIENPFAKDGGLRLLSDNLGRSVIKVFAIDPQHHIVEAPAIIFHDQDEFLTAFKAGKLDKDFIAVARFQCPKANGMPELHKLSPSLASLLAKGRKVALITDGRMSGASSKTPAAIHITPAANDGGPIARLRDGDIIRLDAVKGTLNVSLSVDELNERTPATHTNNNTGFGQELFSMIRSSVGDSEDGANIFWNKQ